MKRILTYIFLTFYFVNVGFSQFKYLGFEHISISDGLSQSEVNCILQDKKGFMWIGTLDGLNRYDGYNFKVYRKNTDFQKSISSNYIETLCEDTNGNLWIGTLG